MTHAGCRRGKEDVHGERHLVHEELAGVDRLQALSRQTGRRRNFSQLTGTRGFSTVHAAVSGRSQLKRVQTITYKSRI